MLKTCLFRNVRELSKTPLRQHMAAKESDGNFKIYPAEVVKCWESYIQKHLNTNWPRKEEAIEGIPDNMSRSTGFQFSLEEIQKAVRAMKSSKPSGADCINAKVLNAGGDKMTKIPMKLCHAQIGATVPSSLYTQTVAR